MDKNIKWNKVYGTTQRTKTVGQILGKQNLP